MTGGYYWLPAPSPEGITWSMVSCRDLGCGTDAGHDADLWPRLMVPLAANWGKAAQFLKKKLALSYTGLPRRRVTRPDKTFLVLHGNDSPTPMWEPLVIERFRLSGRQVKFNYDEHETQLPGHSRTLEAMLGSAPIKSKGRFMPELFELTDDERCFLSHWMHDAMGPFWGPSVIWCWNNRINWSHAPYPMAMIFSREEIDAGREGWFFNRPPVPFRVPWRDHDEFWRRASASVSDIRIQGVGLYPPASPLVNVKGSLTLEESNYLRAYNQEMVHSGSGHYIDLAHQHGVLSYHLIQLFVLLDDLYRPPTTPVIFPWSNFPARYEELCGMKYSYPAWALISG